MPYGGEPGLSSFTLSDIGKGRLWRWRTVTVLQHLVDGEWLEIGRYGEPAEAGAALDERVGSGADHETLRVALVPMSRTSRVAMIAAVVAGVLILASFVYVLSGG